MIPLLAGCVSSQCCCLFWVRHGEVQGLLATLNLKARQDLLTVLWNLINPGEDTVTFEAFMNDTSMPPIVLAVATPKVHRPTHTGRVAQVSAVQYGCCRASQGQQQLRQQQCYVSPCIA